MRHPERRASSTRRAPSTPTHPESVGSPPRSAMRNCFSQRFSRLERIFAAAGGAEERGGREGFPRGGITASAANLPAGSPMPFNDCAGRKRVIISRTNLEWPERNHEL